MIIFFLFTSAEEKKDKTAKMVPANYSALFYSDEYCFSIEWRRTMGGVANYRRATGLLCDVPTAPESALIPGLFASEHRRLDNFKIKPFNHVRPAHVPTINQTTRQTGPLAVSGSPRNRPLTFSKGCLILNNNRHRSITSAHCKPCGSTKSPSVISCHVCASLN